MSAAPASRAPHCEPFVRSLEALGRHELASRWEGAKRAIRDNGVTYNVYGDPQGVDRPWTLDMLPLLIAPAEWSRIEARAAAAIAAAQPDPRRPLRSAAAAARGRAAAVAGARESRRFCGRVTASRVPHDIYLHLLAVDLGALAGRSMAGARRSHAGALGRRLRAGKPHRAVAQPARGVSRLSGAAARRRSFARIATD